MRAPAVRPRKGTQPAPGDTRCGDGCWICHLCRVRYRPSQRNTPHTNSPECKAGQVTHAYDARGWTATDHGSARIFREAGVPVEMAPGAWMRAYDKKTECMVQTLLDVPFTPRRAVHGLRMLSNLRIGKGRRRVLCSLLYTDDELFEAASAVARVNADGLRRFLVTRLKELLGSLRLAG